MQAVATGGIWDFTPVLDLISSFAAADQDAVPETSKLEPEFHIKVDRPNHVASLGDFGNIWKSIGCSNDALSSSSPTKRVHWEDEVQKAALAGDHDKAEELINSSKLGKKERKAVRRRVGRVVLQKQSLATPKRNINSSSDDDPTFGPPKQTHISNLTPLRRSARLALKNVASEPSIDNGDVLEREQPKTSDRRALIHELLDRPLPPNIDAKGHINILKRPESKDEQKWPTADPVATRKKVLEEKVYAIVTANKTKIVDILRRNFVEEELYLRNLPILPVLEDPPTTDPIEGLHIFIDASNILIGFHDALKVARSLPRTQRIRRQQLSFQLLSLILSRGRPTAKRVVVGSDNCPEMVEAKLHGYEINILDRVHKAKELTPRQKKYANRENGGGTTSAGSGSETMATAAAVAQFAPEKWVEQGVDEILHLKMMESVVDATEPSTMVLATGDAAEAEFSGGFMRMVERALGKGWKVELACWKHNMSAAYRSHEFRHQWGARFRVVELDDFAELVRVGP